MKLASARCVSKINLAPVRRMLKDTDDEEKHKQARTLARKISFPVAAPGIESSLYHHCELFGARVVKISQ